MTSFVVYLVLP